MSIVKILAIVIVTVAVTLLCIRSGQAMIKSSVPTGTVYHTTDGLTRDTGKLLAVTTIVDNVTSDEPALESQTTHPNRPPTETQTTFPNSSPEVSATILNKTVGVHIKFTSPLSEVFQNVTKEQIPLNRSNTDLHIQATSRSLNTGSILDHLTVRPSVSRSHSPIVVVRGKHVKRLHGPSYMANHDASISIDDDVTNEDDAMNDTPVFQMTRPNHRVNQFDYPTIETDISVAEEDGSAAYQNSYDLTYNTGDSGYRQTDIPIGGYVGNRPGAQMIQRPIMVDGYSSAGHMPAYTYGVPNRPGLRPIPYSDPMNHAGMNVNMNMDTSILSHLHGLGQKFHDKKIDWQKIGILALIKIGLVKLKTFGFLKILFLMVFKLKLFLIAIFFKFLLLLKLMKFFKLLMIPMFLLPLVPVLTSLASPMVLGPLVSLPFRLLSLLTEPTLAPVTAASAFSRFSLLPGANAGGSGSTSTNAAPATKIDENILNRRRLESIDMFDPSLAMFRNILDTEKCLERIACRMSTAEKAGVMPYWVNWFLQRLSKFIPNEKLDSYLKTFEDVSHDIYTKSPTPDNWAAWCVERYHCNYINKNSTNTTETKQ